MNKHDTWIGIGSGLTGGCLKYATINEIQISFSHKLIESALIALVCGAAGMVGKELFTFCKKKWNKK